MPHALMLQTHTKQPHRQQNMAAIGDKAGERVSV